MADLDRPSALPRAAAWASFAASGVLGLTGVALVATRRAPARYPQPPVGVTLLLTTGFLAFGALGLLVVLRAGGHRVGWLLLSTGVLFLAGDGAEATAKHLGSAHGDSPFVAVLSWVDAWAWSLALSLVVITLLLFPTGTVPGRGWRASLWLGVLAAVGSFAGIALTPGQLDAGAHVDNPLGVAGAGPLLSGLTAVADRLQVVTLLAALASLLLRYRRGTPDLRQQLRWLGLAAAALLGGVGVALVGALAGTSLVAVPFLVAVVGIPAAMAVAVLRHRLYDIDLVVNRGLLYLLLTAFVVTVFVVVVAGVGAVVGVEHRPVLSLLAAAVVAVVLSPARTVAQRTVDRAVFGRRATPYQVLTELADRISGEWGAGEVLQRMATMVEDATGATVAAVYLELDGALRLAATSAAGADVPAELPHPRHEAFDLVLPLADRTETLGAIALRKPAGVRVTAGDERVVGYLASHAGLLLGHVRLTTELERHVAELAVQAEEVRRSRQRLVRAQDQERRRLERDLHDGAQQDLVAIMAKARLARNQLDRGDAVTARVTLEQLQHDAHLALTEVRELAHGIFPPVLADRGLVAAVQARAARMPLQVDLQARPGDGLRLPADVEGAAYFVVAEAFANVVKHADAASVEVRLRREEGALHLVVRDDGRGLDGAPPGAGITGMTDRVAALGGTLTVRATSPRGTEVDVRIPVPEEA